MKNGSFKPLVATLALAFAAATSVAAAAEHGGSHAVPDVPENVFPEVRAEVLQAYEAWMQAVIAGDRAALERVYHDELTYGHGDGRILNKAEQIADNLMPGRTFPAVEIDGVTMRQYGGIVLVTASITFHVSQNGNQVQALLRGVDAWLKTDEGWKLVARQFTRPQK